MIFDKFVAVGVVLLQAFLVAIFVSWATKTSFVKVVAKNATLILRTVMVGAILGSLVYSDYFAYPPCYLCWYQRVAIFPIGILLFTATLKNRLLQNQILLLSFAGFLVALFHNIIDIFPTGTEVCGADGISCTARYVYEFGYITIPMMSATVLLTALVVTMVAKRFPQE